MQKIILLKWTVKYKKGLNYDFDEKKAEIANGTQNSSATDTFTTMAAKPKAGYKYVGTVSGHTKESKNAVTLVGSLFGTIPGLGWGAKAAGVLFAYWTKERIPDAYSFSDLPEQTTHDKQKNVSEINHDVSNGCA